MALMSGSPEAAEVDDGSSLPALLAACEASRLALGDIELTLARLGLNVTAAVARTGEDFAILSSALSDVAVEFKREVLRLHRHRLQWLDKHCEELTAVEGVLLAGAGMSDAGLSDLSVVAESVASILPLSTSTVLSQHSLMSMPPSMEEPQALLAKVGSVSDGSMNSFTFTSSGVDFCEPGNVASSNTLTVECRYKDGGCVRGLQAEDFDVSITAVPDGVPVGSVCSVSLSDSTLTVEYSVPLEFAGQSVRITVDLFNCTIWDNVVKVVVPFAGQFQYRVFARGDFFDPANPFSFLPATGMAVNADCTQFALSNSATNRVTMYSLPEGEQLSQFGREGTDPGCFRGISRLRFSPNGTLFVLDSYNKRAVEMTVEGEHVTTLLCPDPRLGPYDFMTAMDVCDGWVATVVASLVFLFKRGDSTPTHIFGGTDTGDGGINFATNVRFSPDSTRIFLVDDELKHVSIFTLDGVWLSHIGVGVLDEPSDVVITVAGDVIVSDAGTHRVCVFPAGGGPMRAFGEEGREGGQFVRPSSLALVDGTLFVLNRSSGCVQAFR